MVRPIALLIFILVMGNVCACRGAVSDRACALGDFLFFFCCSRISPSPVCASLSGDLPLMFLWLLYMASEAPLGMQLLLCCIPSVALMALQFIRPSTGHQQRLCRCRVCPLQSCGYVYSNIAFSTLLVLAFLWLSEFVALCAGHLTDGCFL